MAAAGAPGAAKDDRLHACRRSRQSRSRRNTSCSAKSTVAKVASAVAIDQTARPTRVFINFPCRGLAEFDFRFVPDSISLEHQGSVAGFRFGPAYSRLLLSIVFSFRDWFGINPSARGAGLAGNLRAHLNRETLLAIARDEHPPAQELLHVGRLRNERELASRLVDDPEVFAASGRWVAQKNAPSKRRRLAHERDAELLR